MPGEIIKRDGIEFEALEGAKPGHLADLRVVAQCLDSQWVPRPMLRQILKRPARFKTIERERVKLTRTEYIRSLINSQQLICNRSYLYNNPTVSTDYTASREGRKAFKRLLRDGVIVPYLFRENSPLEEPNFTKDTTAFAEWRRLSSEVRMKCVRLSWDQRHNEELTNDHLARRFHNFAQTAYNGNIEQYIRDLGLEETAADALRQRLLDLARKCLDLGASGRHATREELYKEFVTGGDPAERRYDPEKPFVAEIKELLDLSYNTNLPDALGGYALTPRDSLPRTALQELDRAKKQQAEITPDKLVDLLRRCAFDLVQGGLYLKSLGSLNLEDVEEIRGTDEWRGYLHAVNGLLKEPEAFDHLDKGAGAVYGRYVKLAERITKRATVRNVSVKMAKWEPIIEILLEVGGGAVAILFDQGRSVGYKLVADLAHVRAAREAAPFVARLVIRGRTERKAQADLASSIDLMHTRIEDATEKWGELKRRLASEFKHLDSQPVETQDATVNFREEPDA